MASFNSFGALKLALQKEMRQALQETAEKAYDDTLLNNKRFYSGGTPKRYIRTGMFGNAAKIKPIQGGDDSISVDVGRDGDYSYDTGMHPSGWTVFSWAESGSHGLVGLTGTWADTEADIQVDLDSIFSSHFN